MFVDLIGKGWVYLDVSWDTRRSGGGAECWGLAVVLLCIIDEEEETVLEDGKNEELMFVVYLLCLAWSYF